jgi:hypothetical protein
MLLEALKKGPSLDLKLKEFELFVERSRVTYGIPP